VLWKKSVLVFVASCGVSAPARAQVDQGIYTDTLVSGWQSWSWATVNLSSSSTVHGGTHSMAVVSGPYEALYLHHAALDGRLYSSLTFWIHGGATAGQHLRAQATRLGEPQPPVALPTLTSSWQQVTLSLPSLGVSNAEDFDGFWLQETTGSTQPTYYVDDARLVGAVPPATVHLALDPTAPIRTVDDRHFGLNAAVWDASFETPATSSLLSEIDDRALRFPGGSLSDEYHWATNTTGSNQWTWATSFDSFAAIAVPLQATVYVTVNYGTGTPEEAAAWVTYANVTKGWGVAYWEVGNECYGSWETDANTRAHDPVTYANRFAAYVSQMKAADPSIKVGAVVETGEDSYANYGDESVLNPRTGQTHGGWTPVMLARLKVLGVTPDFVIYHRYAQEPSYEDDLGLLHSSGTWASDAADLRQQLSDYLGAPGAGVKLVCTENNSVSSHPGKQTTSLVNGLFLADSLGHAMQTEFDALLWWDLRNSQETGNNDAPSLYGWRTYGDYGVVDDSTSPAPADRYPAFYVLKLMKSFARGGDTVISAVSDWPELAAFAARRKDGTLTLLVLNKSASASRDASIAVRGWTPAASALLGSYGIPQDEAARTSVGSADVGVSFFGAAAKTFPYTFPPYSATLFTFTGHWVGDANGDGTVDVADVFWLVNALFAGGPAPIGSGDANGDGNFDVADVFYLINSLFAGGPAPL
jgi:alpha-L-arabinofuranosidase